MKKFVMALALSIGLFTACNDEEVFYDPDLAGDNYYPLHVGDIWTYKVTDIAFLNDVGDTTEFEQKEEIDTIITDQTGKKWYRVQLSRKEEGANDWVPTGIKFISRTSTDLRVITNNITEVQMIFPVATNKTWNSNAYNSRTATENYYDNIGTSYTANGTTYENTARVIKAMSSSAIVRNEQWQIVANGVGPVYRYYNVVNYCNDGFDSNTCPYGQEFITDGSKREEVLTSYTKGE